MKETTDIRPLRILHVLKGMGRGGIETWLMNVLRDMDRNRFRFDFLTGTMQSCAHDEELRAMGCGIYPCMGARSPIDYAKNFFRILKQRGPYDVIHSHVHHYSGFVCWLAHRAGIPKRIAHSHSDTRSKEATSDWARRGYLKAMEYLIARHATHGLACSRYAASALFGRRWDEDARWRVLPCGIPVGSFEGRWDRDAIRSELGIPHDAIVVGHVGRFFEVKNHSFMLDVLAMAMAQRSGVYGLLVGDGPLRSRMEAKATQLGIRERVIFAGERSDVARLMTGAMDVFLFPSLYEGLPIALIEAQAAGMKCLRSDTITGESDIVPGFIVAMSLDKKTQEWAQALLALAARRDPVPGKALDIIKRSRFSIEHSVQTLERLYMPHAEASSSGGTEP